MDDGIARTRELYRVLASIPQYRYPFELKDLPKNGIYLFFEAGETCAPAGRPVDRVVRVGTHRGDNRFRQRIRQHFGQVKSERGNKNGSIFRKHVGGAMLRRMDSQHPHLPDWFHTKRRGKEEYEILVSRTLRKRFTFSCFEVPTEAERLELESSLIATLAQHPIGKPSFGWLGYYARNEAIHKSGLWNTQRVDAEPLSRAQLDRIKKLITKTTSSDS